MQPPPFLSRYQPIVNTKAFQSSEEGGAKKKEKDDKRSEYGSTKKKKTKNKSQTYEDKHRSVSVSHWVLLIGCGGGGGEERQTAKWLLVPLTL